MFRFHDTFATFQIGHGAIRGICLVLFFCLGWVCVENQGVRGEDWVDRRKAGIFKIRADFPLQNEEALLGEMEHLSEEIGETLGIEMGGEGAEILLFGNRRAYQQYLSTRVPEGVNRPALFVKTETMTQVYAYRCPELSTNLRHEATHALLHGSLQIIPLWLDEGLAEYFEVPTDRRAEGNPHLKSLQKWNSRLSWRLRLSALDDKESMTEMDSRDYRDAFSVVHFLIHGPPEARQVFHEYLREIQEGEIPTPLPQQLAEKFSNVDVAVMEHIRNW